MIRAKLKKSCYLIVNFMVIGIWDISFNSRDNFADRFSCSEDHYSFYQ